MVEFARTQKQGVEDQDTPSRVEPLDHDYELSQDLRAQHDAMGARQAWARPARRHGRSPGMGADRCGRHGQSPHQAR